MHPRPRKPTEEHRSRAERRVAMWIVPTLIGLPGLFAAEAPPAAVVANVRGTVTVQRAGQGPAQAVKASSPLYAGDLVRTEKPGSATIYFPQSRPRRLGPNRRFTVPAGPSREPVDRPSPWRTLWRALVACLKRSLGITGVDRPAAVRGVSEEEGVPTALWPRETRLLAPPDRFVWQPAPGATRYEIVVGFYDTDERIWSAAAAHSRVAYPAEAPRFQPDRRYFWQVTSFPDEQQDSSWFILLKPEAAEALRAARAALPPDDPAGDLALASLELENGLLADALMRLSAALEQRPDDPLRWRMLSEAYRQALLPQRARAAAEKAGPLPETERQEWSRVQP